MSSLSWLLMASSFAATWAICDKTILPAYTFMLSGFNLEWPCSSTKNIFLSSGRYLPKNIIPTRLQIYKDKAFVLTPRYKPGVPLTLGKLSLKSKHCQAMLEPFPCWSMQEEGNCNALQSAVDLFLDPHDILWVLDVGIVNTLDHHPVRRCPPKIVAINAKTGIVVKVIHLAALVTPASRLQFLVVDYSADGRVFVYVSDAALRAIVVYDVTAGSGYRVFLPKAVLAGCTYRDVLYLALVRKSCGTTVLYFTYLGGAKLFSIKTDFLRGGSAHGTVVDVGHKSGRMVVLGTDGGSAIFFRLKGDGDIYMWNTETCFKHENFLLVQKGNKCRLATQVVPGYKRLMWVIESNFKDYIHGGVGCAGASVVLHPIVKTCNE